MSVPVLVLAAHPDDEVLGAGGTIARLAAEGREVHIAILGEGITSRYADRAGADSSLLEALHETSRRVGELLGARDVVHAGLPDNRFDTVPLLDVVKTVEQLVERLRPEWVFTQAGGDLNIDHVVLYRATLTATRPLAGHPVKRVYAYEVASSSEWAFSQYDPVFRPNTFVDITETLGTKVCAMELYESEARPFPHPRAPESLRAIARRWGSTAGLEAAEAFQLVRSVGL